MSGCQDLSEFAWQGLPNRLSLRQNSAKIWPKRGLAGKNSGITQAVMPTSPHQTCLAGITGNFADFAKLSGQIGRKSTKLRLSVP